MSVEATPVTPNTQALVRWGFKPAQIEETQHLLSEAELASFAQKADEVLCVLREVRPLLTKPIASEVEHVNANNLLTRGVTALKSLEELREKRAAPVWAEFKAINALFKLVSGELDAALEKPEKGGKLERLILAWRAQEKARIQREQEEADRKQRAAAEAEAAALRKAEAAKTETARRKALDAAEAASKAQTAAALAAPAPMMKGVYTDSGKVTATERWTYEVVDQSLVPRQYLCVDTSALAAAVKSGVREIPGVSVFQAEGLRRNTGR